MEIDRDVFAFRDGFDQFGLVLLADALEVGDGLVPRPHLAAGRQRGLHDLMHFRFDLRQVLRGEGLVAREVVIEAVLDRRADRHLGAGIERLHGHREHMGGVVADQLQRLGVPAGDDPELGVRLERAEDVDNLAVGLDRQGGLGQARADGRRRSRAPVTPRANVSALPSGRVMVTLADADAGADTGNPPLAMSARPSSRPGWKSMQPPFAGRSAAAGPWSGPPLGGRRGKVNYLCGI